MGNVGLIAFFIEGVKNEKSADGFIDYNDVAKYYLPGLLFTFPKEFTTY
jgi:hypothetical protein